MVLSEEDRITLECFVEPDFERLDPLLKAGFSRILDGVKGLNTPVRFLAFGNPGVALTKKEIDWEFKYQDVSIYCITSNYRELSRLAQFSDFYGYVRVSEPTSLRL